MSKKIIITVFITVIIVVIVVGLIVAASNLDFVGILKRLHGV